MPNESLFVQSTKSSTNIIYAVTARTHWAKYSNGLEKETSAFWLTDAANQTAVIIMSIKDYINTIAPPTAATQAIRKDARRKGTSTASMREIDRVISAVRRESAPRKSKQLIK